MINDSAKYRQAAEICRRMAKSSPTPRGWLGFAAEWDNLAEQDDFLFGCDSLFDQAALRETAIRATSAVQARTIN
jgi:hypothetical protein